MTTATVVLDPEILHGGLAWVVLPEPPAGLHWRVEWRVIGTGRWRTAATGVAGGERLVPGTETPEPQHRIEWRSVAGLDLVDRQASQTVTPR